MKKSYSDIDKERLKMQAFRINDEMVNQQIGLPELVELTGLKGRDKLKKYDVKSFVEYEF